jgi:formate hydrogenlyase subunit 4
VTIIASLLTQVLHIILIAAAAPTAAGVLAWLDARLTGRTGPSVLLPWRDLVRLSRKTPLIIEPLSFAARYATALSLAATLLAAALVPSFTLGMALSPLADVLVVITLLTVARMAAALAALDSGAAWPGVTQQGASALAVLAEPALMLVVVTPALMGGSFNLDVIIDQQHEGVLLPAAASALDLAALLALVLAQVSTTQDAANPMQGGLDLAMAWITGWLRRLIWIDLIGGLFLPFGIASAQAGPLGWLIGLAAWAIKLAVFLLVVSAIKAFLGRIPRHSLPDLIGVAALLALLAIVMVLASTGMA